MMNKNAERASEFPNVTRRNHTATGFLVLASLLLLILACGPGLDQQGWQRTYGGANEDWGSSAKSVQQTSDGGYIVVGYTSAFVGGKEEDVYLIKTDAAGQALWTRTYGGTDADRGSSVQQTSDGGYIVAGCTFVAGWTKAYLIKADAAGETLWTRTYGGTRGDDGLWAQQTSDGGYIVAGFTSSFGVGGDVYLIKTSALGDTQWTRTYGGMSSDQVFSAQQTSDGGHIVAGQTQSFGAGSADVYLIKTNAAGDTLWTRTYGGTNWDWGFSVQQTLDGGYIVAGETDSKGAGHLNVYLIKADTNGNSAP
jgi:hypothetical protein